MPSHSKVLHLCVPIHITDVREYVIGSFCLELDGVPLQFGHKKVNMNYYCPDSPYTGYLSWEDSCDKERKLNITKCNMTFGAFQHLASSKCFNLVSENIKSPMDVEITLNSNVFLNLTYACEPLHFRPRRDVCKVFHYLGISLFDDFPESHHPETEYIEMLFEMVQRQRLKIASPVTNNDTSALMSTLRQYQKDAVTWMLSRESVAEERINQLHPLFIEYETIDGAVIYAHRHGGFFTKERYCASHNVHGGILADEMGLGKTLEVLSLILNHPKPLVSEENMIQVSSDNSNNSEADDFDRSSLGSSSKVLVESNRVYPMDIPGSGGSKRFCASSEDVKFVCICGKATSERKKNVKCSKCYLSQHLECVFAKEIQAPDPYICPFCMIEETVPSRATLIVSPSSISHQWFEEIQRHVIPGSLKVFCYGGVKDEKFIPPSILANNDIVIVTYETFRKEVKFVGVQRAGLADRRQLQKYTVLPSPLTAVHWWRICLDEAQMVEASTSKVAYMALQLKSQNRWCVSGTPVQKTVMDLYGIFLFLKYEPYVEKKWFQDGLYKPFTNGYLEHFAKTLMPIFWRTLKKDVSDQIGLLPHIDIDHKLVFSSVEKFFYERQHRACAADFCKNVENMDPFLTLKSLDRRTLSKIMLPLKKLRQACCHPQTVKGQFSPLSKSIMSMEEISEALIKKTELECEEAHRSYVAALNGLAGIEVIEGNVSAAVITYLKVLSSVERQQHLKTDKLQLIHTLHNLADVVKEKKIIEVHDPVHENDFVLRLPSGEEVRVPHYLISIKNIVDKEEKLASSYLLKHEELINRSKIEMMANKDKADEINCKVMENKFNGQPWWSFVLQHVKSSKKEEELLNKVRDTFNMNIAVMNAVSSIVPVSFSSTSGLIYICTRMFDQLLESRNALHEAMEHLIHQLTFNDLSSAANCHLRSSSGQIRKCKYCEAEIVFDAYENKLFNVVEDKRKERSNRTLKSCPEEEELANTEDSSTKKKGTWADGPFEQILKVIINFNTSKTCTSDALEAGSSTLAFIDALKKEFKSLRSVWIHVGDYISAFDELCMARTRYTLENDSQARDQAAILPSMLPVCRANLLAEKVQAKKTLKEQVGRLLFLKNILKAYTKNDGSLKDEDCPVCKVGFELKWAIFCCGHRICVNCLSSLMDNQRANFSGQTSCPVCRTLTVNPEILFLNFRSGKPVDSCLKGSYSTKVFAILECLVRIQNEDSGAKSIVFSSFDAMLNIVAEALRENCIPFINMTKRKDFQINLEKFKKDKNYNILLLPIRTGANGLNIIEATHVLFIEPLLNLGLADQAISRIHRIGQQKQTIIHCFYIEGTIEERILNTQKRGLLTSDIEININVNEVKSLFHN